MRVLPMLMLCAGTAAFAAAPVDEPSSPIAGCWDVVVKTPIFHPDLKGRFLFTVEGQALRGTVTLRGADHGVRDGSVDGDRFKLSIAESEGRTARFQGVVDAGLRGTMTHGGRELTWTAKRCPQRK